MKKILTVLTLFFISSCAIGAGENSRMIGGRNGFFPRISGIDLDGQKHQMPQIFQNKINVVIFYFNRQQQEDAFDWFEIIEPIMKKYPEVSFYEMPIIEEQNMVAREILNNELRRNAIDAAARKRTIAVYTDREKFLKTMKMKDDKVYLMVIGDNGKMMQKIEGGTSEQNISAFKKKWAF